MLTYKNIILGSNSPRRKELLRCLDVDFTVDTGNTFEETLEPGLTPCEVPVHMSLGKSHGFHRPLSGDEVLLTADTIVIADGKALGKPHSREDAVAMLEELSGRDHLVVTAVTLRDSLREKTVSDCTRVWFRELEPSEIDYYVDTYKPYDKAGAYGVQEWIGYVAIGNIEGSFYNVMGLPVHKVYDLLKEFGVI
ncbi:MAG: septum formation protein Maf [Bacteroidales bacterium]|nr:septum formation protein Maf [Bacteroidales bacterium]